MLKYLIKTKIKGNDFSKKKNRDEVIKLTGILGLVINLFLFSIKITIGLLINSIAIISDSLNNLSDSLTSIVVIISSIISAKPADEEHPFGHGRIEYVVTLSVGLFIVIVGFQLLISSISEIFNPQIIKYSKFTIIILIISILLKIYMHSFNKYTEKLCDSSINKVIAKDSLNDALATFFVLVSIFIFQFTRINIDGFIGLVISILVMKTGVEMMLEMGIVLLGKQIDKDLSDKMEAIILKGKYIKGVHAIEIHEYGKGQFHGSCHCLVPANIDMFSMHKIINAVEEEVYDELGIKLSIHADPNYLLEKDHFEKVHDIRELDEIDL